jgi:uncharacterized membrane protein
MSQGLWAVVFLVVLAIAYFGVRKASATEEKDAEEKPITLRAELGFGIIALGVLILFMPSSAAKIAAFDFVESDAFAILIGATYVMGILVTLAGVAVVLVKERSE